MIFFKLISVCNASLNTLKKIRNKIVISASIACIYLRKSDLLHFLIYRVLRYLQISLGKKKSLSDCICASIGMLFLLSI